MFVRHLSLIGDKPFDGRSVNPGALGFGYWSRVVYQAWLIAPVSGDNALVPVY